MLPISPVVGVLLAITASLVLLRRWHRNTKLPYPPGPKGYPVIGNVLDIPRGAWLWGAATQMGREYDSDILYLNFLGTDIIILNSSEAILDLSEKRSKIYSGRRQAPMAKLIDTRPWMLPFLDYGDRRWRSGRRLFHEFLNVKATRDYDDLQYHHTRDFILRLAESPEDLWDHMKFSIGAFVMSLTYGFDIRSHDDPFLAAADRATVAIQTAVPSGTFIVNTFPILKHIPSWFPGAGFKRIALAARRDLEIVVHGPVDHIKETSKSGSARRPSVASSCLDRLDDLASQGVTEDDIRSTTASLYMGAIDTTLAISQSFFLLMAIHPSVQKKAQQEIDRLLGGERLPVLSDQDDLAYLSALIKEAFRWHTLSPMGGPKCLKVDDVYRGYHLPKGATVIENLWAVFHDPVVYPEPYRFNPERFLKDGKLDPSVKDPEDRVFGSGRRACPGRHLVSRTIFLRFATILATFDIEPGTNDKGEVESEIKFREGFVRHPVLFKCLVKPRSEAALKLVRDAHSAGSR